jgi:hypothetical protein
MFKYLFPDSAFFFIKAIYPVYVRGRPYIPVVGNNFLAVYTNSSKKFKKERFLPALLLHKFFSVL